MKCPEKSKWSEDHIKVYDICSNILKHGINKLNFIHLYNNTIKPHFQEEEQVSFICVYKNFNESEQDVADLINQHREFYSLVDKIIFKDDIDLIPVFCEKLKKHIENEEVFFNRYHISDAQQSLFENKLELGGLYHGTPYEFKEFKTKNVGSGEGAQAYGWGLYFTDVKDIAKYYADKLQWSMNALIINGKPFDINNEIHYSIGNIIEVWQIQDKKELLRRIDTFIDKYTESIPYHASWKDKADEMVELKKYVENNDIQFPYNKIVYTVTLHKHKNNEEYDFMRWDEPITSNQKLKIVSNIDSLNKNEAINRLMSILSSPDWYRTDCGSSVYEYITDSFEVGLQKGQELASKFLLSVGIDGIKYPANMTSPYDNRNIEGFNYVVFDDKEVTIEDKEYFD